MREEAKTIGGLCLKVGDYLWHRTHARLYEVTSYIPRRYSVAGATGSCGVYVRPLSPRTSDNSFVCAHAIYNKERVGDFWRVPSADQVPDLEEEIRIRQQELSALEAQRAFLSSDTSKRNGDRAHA